MWLVYALLAALTAGLVAIFAKVGLQTVDPRLATALRSVIMMISAVSIAGLSGAWKQFSPGTIGGKEWMWIVLAGLSGALSWLFGFLALKDGNVVAVTAIDKLSLVITSVVAVLILGEMITWKAGIGLALVTLGIYLVAFWK
jgi:transporter family protein